MPERTSQSDPLRIDIVKVGDAGGAVGITFCPGKHDCHWARDLAADLDVIARWQPRSMLTLIEDHEFDLLCVRGLGEQVQARGIDWRHMPIIDVEPPDARFERIWESAGPELCSALRDGARVLVHCRGGLGRAGTVAALLLVGLGVPAPDSVARVRKARPGAIETTEQERYVLGFSESMRGERT